MSTLPDDEIRAFILRTFRDLAVDVDVDKISGPTVLKTLGLRSIVLINAVAEIQEHFKLRNRLLNRILGGTRPLDEHTVDDLVAFVVADGTALDD
jgi:hypothetical protein